MSWKYQEQISFTLNNEMNNPTENQILCVQTTKIN